MLYLIDNNCGTLSFVNLFSIRLSYCNGPIPGHPLYAQFLVFVTVSKLQTVLYFDRNWTSLMSSFYSKSVPGLRERSKYRF